MPRLSDTAIADIESSLTRATDAPSRRFVVRNMAAQYGVTEASIYSRFPAGRPKRSDAGVRKAVVDPDAYKDALAIKVQRDGVLGWRRIGQMVDAGVSASTLRRWAEADGVTMRRITHGSRAYRAFEAAHANALHQMDETLSLRYHANADETLRRYDIPPYKNKPQPEKIRLHFFLTVDDKSRMKCARYYLGKGDTVPMRFMFDTWKQKDGGLLWGMPDAIYVDQDSIFKSGRVLRALALERLGVEIKRTLPKSPWSKGKVEKGIGDFMRSFEQMIDYMDIRTIDELNFHLDRFVRLVNWEEHSVTKQKPALSWLQNLPADRPVRLLPDDEILCQLMREEIRRKVDAQLQLRLKDEKRGIWYYYSLNPIPQARGWVGEEVTISYYPGNYSTIYVCHGDTEIEVQGQTTRIVNETGNFEGQGWTSNQQAVIAELAAREVVVRPNWEKYLPAEATMPRIAPAAEQIESPMFARPATVLARVDGKYKANEIMLELAGRELSYDERGEYNGRFAAETVSVDEVRQWVGGLIRRGVDEANEAVAG